MTRRDFKKQIDHQLSFLTTTQTDYQRIVRKAVKGETTVKKVKWAPVLALGLVLLLAGTVLALSLSPTVDFFGIFYGKEYQKALEQGETEKLEKEYVLGQTVFTLYDVVAAQGVIYGSGEIHPKEGENIVLLAPDMGGVHSKARDSSRAIEESEKFYHAKETDPTYAQVAEEKNADILMAQVIPDGILKEGELVSAGDMGFSIIPMANGGLFFSFEIYLEEEIKDGAELQLYLSTNPVTLEDEYVMDQRIKHEWVVPITISSEAYVETNIQ